MNPDGTLSCSDTSPFGQFTQGLAKGVFEGFTSSPAANFDANYAAFDDGFDVGFDDILRFGLLAVTGLDLDDFSLFD